MLLKSTKNNFNNGSFLLDDLRDLENIYCFAFPQNVYLPKLDELKNVNLLSATYKNYTLSFPAFTCSCNNHKTTELIISNFCIHLKNKTLTLFKNKLSSINFLLLKDFTGGTITYKFCDEENLSIFFSVIPYKKYITLYYPTEINNYKKIKYYPLNNRYEFGIKFFADQKVIELVNKTKEKLIINYDVINAIKKLEELNKK